MGIKDWLPEERPRERLLKQGADALSDAELFAILLRTGNSGLDAVQLARAVLTAAGGLRRLAELDRSQFLALPGLGVARYAELQAALEFSRRYLKATLERDGSMHDPASAKAYILARLKPLQREVFACVFLDTRHRVMACEVIFYGTIDSATVHPREVVKRVLELNAAAVIFAHNHPSGIAEPSQADQALTRRLRDALMLIDVRVLDHIVAADGETVSFADRGLL